MTVLKIWNGSEWVEISPTVGDHGDLTGLQDDDHTHYTLADGTRAFVGTVAGIDPIDSEDLTTKNYVDSNTVNDLNSLTGSVVVSGIGEVAVTKEGQNIVVSGTPHNLIAAVTLDIPNDEEDFTIMKAVDDITLSQMFAVIRGPTSPTVTWTVRHGANRLLSGTEVVTGGTTTTSTTFGDTITTLNNPTVTGSSWLWLETTASGGSPQELTVELYA